MSQIAPEEKMLNPPELKKSHHKWQKNVFKFMDSGPVQTFLITLLMLSLFLADSWVLGNAPDSSNDVLYGLLSVIFGIFVIETSILSLVQDGYLNSFFFYMDILGTISIILDIGWIADAFLPQGGIKQKGSILRATRAAKLGARYGRLMRLLKLMRFFRYLPCFASKDGEAPEPTMTAVRRVSSQLSTVLSQRVAALVMIVVIVVPFLGYDYTDYSGNAWVGAMSLYLGNNTLQITSGDLETYSTSIDDFYHNKDAKLYEVMIVTPWLSQDYTVNYHTRPTVRSNNINYYTENYFSSDPFTANGASYTTADPLGVNINIDNTIPNQMDSMYGIILIIMVIFLLFSFSASFHNAVDKLVVVPLEKMMNTLRTSATVMLKSMKAMEEEKNEEELKEKNEDSSEDDEELETQMLEKMVEKLARIVQHMLPGGQEMQINENVDKATASWLSHTYTAGYTKVSTEATTVVVDEEAERNRLQSLLERSESLVSLDVINSFEFDVLNFKHDELIEIVTLVVALQNFFQEFNIPQSVFREFMKEVSVRYLNNTYHNFFHCVDVFHTVYRLIFIPSLNVVFSHLEVLAMMIAALGHDIGHPGVNNIYLVKAKHELALKHNDRSPLENMHCAVLFEILSKSETNIFVNYTEKQWRDTRKIILTSILGTDMSHHFEQISKVQVFLEVNGEDVKKFCSGEKESIDALGDENNRLFIMELILHCADISNPYKPFDICAKWADRVAEEFCLQGEREKREGLDISPGMDRATLILCNMQMGFIEFAVAPLINAFVNVFPPLHVIGSLMLNNFVLWAERRKGDIAVDDKIADKAEETRKLEERVGKFREKMAFLANLRAAPQRRASATKT